MEYKLKILIVCILFVAVSISTSSESINNDKNIEETSILFKIQHPSGSELLRIARAGEEAEATTEANGEGTGDAGNATTSDQCDNKPGCCYQFTWPGPQQDTGLFNFTCEKYKKEKGTGPCKNPVVFTYGGDIKASTGLRPNLTKLITYCEETKCRVYCPKTRSCVKYSYFTNDGSKRILFNETKFCGAVTSVNSGSGIQNGCFQEKTGGFTREVCVCPGNRCNSSSTLSVTNTLSILALLCLLFSTKLQSHSPS